MNRPQHLFERESHAMSTMIETTLRKSGTRIAANAGRLCAAMLTFAVIAVASGRADAQSISKGAENYKP